MSEEKRNSAQERKPQRELRFQLDKLIKSLRTIFLAPASQTEPQSHSVIEKSLAKDQRAEELRILNQEIARQEQEYGESPLKAVH